MADFSFFKKKNLANCIFSFLLSKTTKFDKIDSFLENNLFEDFSYALNFLNLDNLHFLNNLNESNILQPYLPQIYLFSLGFVSFNYFSYCFDYKSDANN